MSDVSPNNSSATDNSVITSSPNQTRSGELREKIEEQIATGRFLPGRRLDEIELAEQFGVSRTPIREALFQLASVGILEMRPRRGAIVPNLSSQRLVEMFQVMAELEAMCGRLAARRMSETDHQTLLAAHRACDVSRSNGSPDDYYSTNETFHKVIYAGAHNAYLAELTLATRARVQPFRRAQFRTLGRLAHSHLEHDRVVVAIQRGERERAAGAMRAHIVTVRQAYEAYAAGTLARAR